jgi:hypothetical protein
MKLRQERGTLAVLVDPWATPPRPPRRAAASSFALPAATLPSTVDPLSPYQNYIHKDGEVVLCMNNFAEQDGLWGRPERMYWSDLVANAARGLCASTALT